MLEGNQRPLEVFNCLSREGKKLMIGAITISISRFHEFEPQLLHKSGKLDSELLEIINMENECREYFSKIKELENCNAHDEITKLPKPELYTQISSIDEVIEDKFKDKLLLNYDDKKKYIDEMIQKFACTGSYHTYVTLIYTNNNFSEYNGELSKKARSVLDDALIARKSYLVNS
ncbi:hypothetical protein fgpv_125 [Flamingopox virus FGPVKD09]|uniref:Uncharacterized protein n=1 Tax=Flamingopox virus FGPVKD09 TaxID=2059380 RepID=A0A2H4X2C8_9POXV|nr:hypothetical protein C1178_gp125 [Flamingopox virus FGPVKD09]AUD40225.1 hypothetical protein fgpv_125 [Flamingopox virus FGPVKD09]